MSESSPILLQLRCLLVRFHFKGSLFLPPRQLEIKLQLMQTNQVLTHNPPKVREEEELSMDDLVKLVAEKEELLSEKEEEIKQMLWIEQDNFAKSLLDVADNLGRASSVVKESFSKLDTTKEDLAGATPLLKTLLEGVFKKFGMEKYDPINEPFDPNRHNAVFQVPDASKPQGTVAHVLKSGYTLFDRVIRPAEVGVTQGGESEEDKKESDA
ncbi:grpE protein homolog 2, mitochondrial-like [Brassica napus]|uniref:grpE protein homolog 2, mitochondrial-like n=1 Tax=Brassica napus TaxID=3708 RepID=UPI002078F95C|nr:grpE protein homolog 2, mitochondrial-like [Brassica napus]